MATLESVSALVGALCQHRLLEPAQQEELTGDLRLRCADARALARELLHRNWLTAYQVNQLLQGKGPDLVLGPYVLLERLGEGGMGEVFKARHRRLGRMVALKLIRKERVAHPEAVKRFRREIHAAAQLSHPNIVAAYDADEVGGVHFLVMEYVEGTDLARVVKQRGPLPVVEACDCVRQAAAGLQHAHERGLIHRDIKPHNLLLTGQGTVKILDMGLARLDHSPGDGATSMTHEGTVMGTPDYIAPEQARESHTADVRADLYSLGCTLYFLLTGRVPFPGGTMIQKINKHQFEEPTPVELLRPDVPAGVAAVVRRLMAKRPEDRYQTPGELATALASVAQGVRMAPRPAAESAAADTAGDWSAVATPPSLTTRLAPAPAAPAGRRWAVWPGAAAAIGVAVIVLAIMFGRRHLPPAAGPESAAVHVVGIEAGKPWQDTGVDVRAGESVRIEAHGEWRKGSSVCSARGLARASRERAVLADAPLLCLLVRVGDDPAPLAIEGTRVIIAGRAGRLFAQANDLELDEDHGRLDLVIDGGTPGAGPAPAPPPTAVQAAEAQYHPLAARAAEPLPDADALYRDVIAFRVRHAGLPQALRAAALLHRLPSPLDRLDRARIPAVERFDHQPAELVAVLGEERGWHGGIVQCVTWRHDGKLLASAGLEGTVRLWDPATMRPVGHTPIAGNAAAFSPDGGTLAVGGAGVQLWDVSGSEPHQTAAFGETPGLVRLLAFAPEGQTLAVVHGDGTVRLWDVGKRPPRETAAFRPVPQGVGSLAFSPDGKRMAFGSHGADRPHSTVHLWDVAQTPPRETAVLTGHADWVDGVAFAPDGRTLASVGTFDFTLRLWDLTGPRPREKQVIRTDTSATCVAFAPDGRTLAAGTWDVTRSIMLWNLAGGAARLKVAIRAHTEQTWAVAFAPDGRNLATAGGDGAVRLWDLTHDPPVQQAAPHGHTRAAVRIAFAPDGRQLVSAGQDAVVRFWDAQTGRPVRTIASASPFVGDVAYSPDGRRFALAESHDGPIRLLELPGQQPVRTLPGVGGTTRIAISGDGRLLAASFWTGAVRAWDLASGREAAPFRGHDGTAWSVAAAPDGRTIASAGKDGTVRVWDVATGKERFVRRGQGTMNAVAFSPDGKLVAAGGGDGVVRVCDATTGHERGALQGHRHVVLAVAFADDGALLASAGGGAEVILWRAPSWTKWREWRLRSDVTSVAFAPDGRHLATAHGSGTVCIMRYGARNP